MKLYCYSTPPIDYWTGAMTRSQLLTRFCSEIGDIDGDYNDRQEWSSETGWNAMIRECKEIGKLVDLAESAFMKIGWEGDYTGGAYYFSLPSDGQMVFGYMVKQSNNGNCFIASPYELPHIDELQFDKIITE